MKINFNIKLSKSQQEVYDAAHDPSIKYLTVAFSRQSGKTTLMKVLCVEWLMEKNRNLAYVCRNYILAKTIYRSLLKIIPRAVIVSANAADLIITTKFGSTLTLFSAESGASLRGQTFHYLICDEFAFFNFQQTDGTNLWHDILSPTLKAKGLKCIFVSTPLGKENLFFEMYMRGLDDDYPQYKSILKTIYDDGFVTEEGIEEIRKNIPNLSFRQEYLCEFLTSALSFFEDYDKVFQDYEWHPTKTWIGVDLSGGGTDSTVVTKVNELNQIKQYVVRGNLESKYNEIAQILNESEGLEMVYIEANGIGEAMIPEILKRCDRRVKDRCKEWMTTNSSKTEIITHLAVRISKGECMFPNDNHKLYSELGTFIVKYSKTGLLQFFGRDGRHDDHILSLAIAFRCKEDYDTRFTKTFFSVVRV